MTARTLFILGLCFSAVAAVKIEYFTLPQSRIEERLRAVETKASTRRLRLRELFETAGCTQLEDLPVKHFAPNLACSTPGKLDSVILIGAHFDFVDRGKGVVDNWSGASLLPSLFESIGKLPRRHRFVFVGFTAEEQGLLGSKAYVAQLSKQQRQQIHGVINLDSLGTGPTKVEADRGDPQLAGLLASIARSMSLPVQVVNVHKVGRSDSDSFQDAGIPTLNIHSLTQETFPILHSPQDRIEAIRMDDYYATYRLLTGFLALLDVALDPDPLTPAAEAPKPQ